MTIEWKPTRQGEVSHAEVVPGVGYCGTTGLVDWRPPVGRKCARCRVVMMAEGVDSGD